MAFEQTQEQINNLKTLQQSLSELTDDVNELAPKIVAVDNITKELESGKALIAQAITDKGVPATADESLSELAEKVSEIDWNPNVGCVWDEGYEPKDVLDVFNNSAYLKEINSDKLSNINANTLCPFSNIERIILTNPLIGADNTTPFNVHYLIDFSSNLKKVHLPYARNITVTSGVSQPKCIDLELICDNVTRVISGTGYMALDKNSVYKSMVFGTLEGFNINGNNRQKQYRLRNITVGENTDITLNFSMFWDARDVIAEGQSGIDELNSNIQNNLVANLKDNTGTTAKTVTFGQDLRNVLTAETEQMFADKNWNISPAKTV